MHFKVQDQVRFSHYSYEIAQSACLEGWRWLLISMTGGQIYLIRGSF